MSPRPRAVVDGRGERKLVTVLFVDLTGYTALSASLDPEEVYRFLRPGLLALQRIVERFGGTVPQLMGDGFMAIFGVPSTHEDDAERAVRAALAVREHVTELNAARREIPFPEVHAGINSGEVMVAPSSERSGFAVIGDTVNTASRLADLAPGGVILVDERTRGRSAHAVRYGPRRDRRAKGKPESLPTFEARGLRPGSTTRTGSSSVFVDRRDAIDRVREELREIERSGHARVLLVTGEPGSGKSRLAAELRRRRVARVLVGRCRSFGDPLPLQALAEAVASGLGLAPDASAQAIDDTVSGLAPRVPRPDRPGLARDLRLLLGTEPAAGQHRGSVQDAVRAGRVAIELVASEGPSIVVIDDLHWASAELMDVLRDVQREPWAARVLFLGLSRPGPGLRGLAQIELPLLEADDMRRLARHVLGHEVPEAVEATLTRAGGNPLFLEETLGMLIEAGALAPDEGTWRVVDPEGLRRVPSTIRLLIAARLDGLPPGEKAVLQSAAVSGEVTWDRLLEQVHGGEGLRAKLRSLERRGLLVRRPSLIPGAVAYETKHLLIRDVAYESLPRGERADVAPRDRRLAARTERGAHGGAARAARAPLRAGMDAGTVQDRSLAGHDTAALAVRHLRRWADRTFAYEARLAESIYERALAVAVASAGAIGDADLADLRIGRAESLIEMGRHREARADASEARALATKLRDRGRRARALLALGRTESDLGRATRARNLFEDARKLFHAERDLRGEAWALHRRSESWSVADYDRELEDLEESYRLFGRARDRWGRAIAAQDLAYLLTPRGGAEFRRWFERANRLAGDEGDLRSRASLARTAGYAAFYRGEHALAIAHMREAQPLAARCGDRYAEADALLIQALSEGPSGRRARRRIWRRPCCGWRGSWVPRACTRSGSWRRLAPRSAEANRESLRGGSPRPGAWSNSGDRRSRGLDVALVEAWIRLDRGQWNEVRPLATRLGSGAQRHGWTLWQPLASLLRGRAALGAGRFDEAERELAGAAAEARRCGASGTEHLATLLATQSRLLPAPGRAPHLVRARAEQRRGPRDRRRGEGEPRPARPGGRPSGPGARSPPGRRGLVGLARRDRLVGAGPADVGGDGASRGQGTHACRTRETLGFDPGRPADAGSRAARDPADERGPGPARLTEGRPAGERTPGVRSAGHEGVQSHRELVGGDRSDPSIHEVRRRRRRTASPAARAVRARRGSTREDRTRSGTSSRTPRMNARAPSRASRMSTPRNCTRSP